MVAGSATVYRAGGTLDIAGTFAASGERPTAQSYSMDAESFPPEELFAGGEGQDVVYLFPLKSAKADWGFLAIAQPLVGALGARGVLHLVGAVQ